MEIVRRAGKLFLDTLFPIECIGCAQEGEWLCKACAGRIPLETRDLCFVCKKESLSGRTCFSCRREFSLAGVIRLVDYDYALVHDALRLAKYSYVSSLLPPLLDALCPHLTVKLDPLDIDPRAALLVPVPLHPRRLRERGFNQAEIIAEAFSQAAGARVAKVLARRRAVPPQASLDEADRIKNVKNNFVCTDRAQIAGRYIFIVDDVATTGTTLHECGKVLSAEGAGEVCGLVLAKG